MTRYILPRAYPLSKSHHENYLRRLNSKNVSIQGLQILSGDEYNIDETSLQELNNHPFFKDLVKTLNNSNYKITGIRTMNYDEDNQQQEVRNQIIMKLFMIIIWIFPKSEVMIKLKRNYTNV